MRIIAFITDGSTVRKILEHLGESSTPPNVAPARGPPLWELELAQAPRQADEYPQWDSIPQPEPAEFDQRAAW
jgi:hypothetical protein